MGKTGTHWKRRCFGQYRQTDEATLPAHGCCSSTGNQQLDGAALQAYSQWRFDPRTVDSVATQDSNRVCEPAKTSSQLNEPCRNQQFSTLTDYRRFCCGGDGDAHKKERPKIIPALCLGTDFRFLGLTAVLQPLAGARHAFTLFLSAVCLSLATITLSVKDAEFSQQP